MDMKVSRREFLKTAGVTAGVTAFQGGGLLTLGTLTAPEAKAAQLGMGTFQVRYTADVMCPAECGMEMWIQNGRVAKIYGNKAVPMNDGACCANDFAAFGVIRGLADRGLRVPQDVKVIGFDGVTSGSYTTPALSTIQVDFTQLAKFSVDMLSERIDHGTDEALPPRRAIIGYQLVDRESTAV